IIESKLTADAAFLLMSDHGFGPIEWYVNFNVWLLEQGFIALHNTAYVRQKHWFYRHGATPAWMYNMMTRLGLGGHRVSRFRGKQASIAERMSESVFLSRRHIDWSRTRAYAQGNFGQIFMNLKGRQTRGCIEPAELHSVRRDIKTGLMELSHPETGGPLVEHVYEAEELYHGPHAHLAPDLTVVLNDWRFRTIGLYDFTTNKVISPAFGPTGDHRMEGVLIATGPGFLPGSSPERANLLDIAPTVLHVLGVPVPDDMDGRVLTELLDPAIAASCPVPAAVPSPGPSYRSSLSVLGSDAHGGGHPSALPSSLPVSSAYSEEEDAAIQQRLADLGYL
ncbi:MAG: alkaline phosphatase family protein, partial [Planctomycetaceae bacterium]|nr:alkaline phosphatase family protein [Planctomycetaceae bacterium]